MKKKNQKPQENPKDSSFLLSKESEKKSMSQQPHHEMSRSSVTPLKSQQGSFSENPNHFSSHNITGNLLNPCGDSQSYLDPNYITTSVSPMNTTIQEALKSRHGSCLKNRNMLGGSLDSVGSQRYLDSIPNTGFVNKNNGDQSQLIAEASSNEPMTQNHETWHGTTNDSSTWFTNSQHAYGNNASISSQGDSSQNVMMPFPGGYNSDEEALKSLIDSFWENPYYHETDNITMNSGNLLMNPSGGMLGGLLDQSNTFLGSGENNASKNVMMTSQMQGYQSNIPFGSIESMMNAKREKDEITMIPTPGSANRAQWPIKKILTKSDVNSGLLKLHNKKYFIEKYFQKRLSKVDFRQLVSGTSGISVIMYDNDKHTRHEMRLTIQDKNYVLMGGWQKEFVKRRRLREGQEIGLFFDSTDSRIHFSVLDLENAKVPAKDKKPLVQ